MKCPKCGSEVESICDFDTFSISCTKCMWETNEMDPLGVYSRLLKLEKVLEATKRVQNSHGPEELEWALKDLLETVKEAEGK